MRKRGKKPRIIVVSCPFFCYFIVQVQNVSSPLHNLICGLVHISDYLFPSIGCRFIALNNGVDTEKSDSSNDVMCFVNLFNEFHAEQYGYSNKYFFS